MKLILLILFNIASLPAVGAPPRPGAPAIAFTLRDVAGRNRTLAEFRGHHVLLCFFCGCAACHDFAREWGQVQRSGTRALRTPGKTVTHPITIVVYAGKPAEVEAFANESGLEPAQTVLLPDPGARVTQSYDALLCPRLCVLDSRGTVRYFNNPMNDAPRKTAAGALAARVIGALRGQLTSTSKSLQSTHVATAAAAGLVVVPEPGMTLRSDGARYEIGLIDRLAYPKIERSFTIRNAGETDVIIDRVQSSCACLGVTLAQGGDAVAGNTLRPRQEIGIHAVLDVSQVTPGSLQKFFWVMRKGLSTPALTIELNAMTEPPIRVTPSYLDFGRCEAGVPRYIRFTIVIDKRIARSEGGSVPELLCTTPYVKIVPRESAAAGTEDRPGYVVRSYTAILASQAAIGAFSGTISFAFIQPPIEDSRATETGAIDSHTAAAALKAVSIPIRCQVVGEIGASPGAVLFDVVHPGKDAPQRVRLTGASIHALEGLHVSSNAVWLTARLLAAHASPMTRVLEVAINGKAPAGPVAAQIVVTTASGKQLIVPVSAYVVPGRTP